ncbi:MAG: amino acid adenylation domain-containing protein [Planctomycetes bacterium]|nr:amino acid adenylation domain-containing protein [Planctomycetota bacterium]
MDRKALPSPDIRVSGQGDYLAADNIIEETLVSIWSHVLGLDRVSVTDNFFELGGDSILSMQVIIRARKYKLDLTLSQLFQHNTIRELSKVVEWRVDWTTSGAATATAEALEVIKRIDRSGPLELSVGQQQLWFFSRLESNTAAYVLSYSIRLLGSLDVRLLEKSLNRILERHEILRTTYYDVGGKPLQAVSQPSFVRFPLIDLTTKASSEKNAEVSRIASIEAGTPFDIARDHCLRAQIVKLSKEEHVLLLSLHHIAFDGWSVGVLFKEITEFYSAYQTGKEAKVPRLPIQYADYASWQRRWLETDEFKRQLNYWKTRLDGELPVFELPTDRARPSVQSFNGEWKVFELDRNLTQSLKHLSRRNDCTLFMTLLGAYYVLLSRYSGQNDIVIGSPVANRNVEEIENLIGFFMNSVALRIRPSSDPTFLQLLKCVRETTIEALENQDVPFGTLVEKLRPERSFSHNPIYQVMFVLQNSPLASYEFSGISVSSHEIDSGTALFDLTLNMWEEDSGLNGYFEFNTDLFDTRTIECMVGHYEALLQDIVAYPEKKIGHLQLLKKDELERILYGWNNTYSDFPDHLCIHEIFEERVKSSPAAIALSCPGGERLTYQQLNTRANQLSHCLLTLGVQCNEFVGICVERSIEMIVGILGIIKAGAAYAPIDPKYPSERIAYMLKDTGAKIVLSQARLVGGLPLSGLKTLCLDSDWPDISTYGTGNTNADVCADNLVYIIYTSGSTGTPKGVPITHRNLVHSTVARFEYYPDSVTGFVLLSSFAFDSSVAGLFWTLCQGGTLTLPELGAEQDLQLIVENVQASKASHLLTLPSLYKLLLNEGGSGQLGSLKTVIVAGEACPKELIAHHYTVLPDATLYNEYGPTEGTVWSTVYKTEKDDPFNSVPIGRPIPNMNVYILDKTRQAVPVGVAGEIYISGEGVAQGYHGQTDVTDEKFVSNNFPNSKWDKMYASGDLARYRPDGNIEFLGRIDHQVKIRGYRIELGEIETVIHGHPFVDDVVVIACESTLSNSKNIDRGTRFDDSVRTQAEGPPLPAPQGTKCLVAYVVSRERPGSEISELRQYVAQTLPDYMVPANFIFLDGLPLTPNGKVDLNKLPDPHEHRFVSNIEPCQSTNEKVKRLLRIWQDVLGTNKIGIHDNFFDLGGDSIISMQVIARARQQELHITPKQMFQYPRISDLAAVIDEPKATEAEQHAVVGAVPITPIQQWFHNLNLSHPEFWNQSYLFEVPPEFDLEIFQKSFDVIAMHHDALRMRTSHESSNIVHCNLSNIESTKLSHYDLSGLSPEVQARKRRELVCSHQARLCPQLGKNTQVVYFDSGHKALNRLLIVIHHLVIDTVSWTIILEDLETVYYQLQNNQPVQLAKKTTSFKEWAHSLVEYAKSETLRGEINYWLEPEYTVKKRLPLDFVSGDNSESSACVTTVCLGPEETGQLLQQVPPVYNTKIDDILLTALLYAFSDWTHEQSLALGKEGHGREDIIEGIDLTRTVGWFTSFYQMVLHLDDLSDYGRSIKIIKEQIRTIPNCGIGNDLLRYLSPDKSVRQALEATPKADVLFNYLGQQDNRQGKCRLLRMTGESTGPQRHPDNMRHHIIEINSMVFEGQLRTDFSYSRNLHRASTLEALANAFNDHLKSIIQHCLSDTAGGYTPSDFPEASLNQDDLDDLVYELCE